jgi:TP901 family phage tail tape measure protein
MAFVISTIYKSIDKFSAPLKRMEQANSGFANKLNGTKNMLLSLAGGVSVASLAFGAYNAMANFDDAMASLSAVTGVSGVALAQMKKDVLDLADKTKKSAVDVAKGFEIVGSAMSQYLKDPKSLKMITEAGILLSKASRMDFEPAMNSLTSTMNQFNLAAKDSKKVVDVLTAGEIVGQIRTQDAAQALSKFGAVANSMNTTLPESIALIQILGKKLPKEEIGTAARNLLLFMDTSKGASAEAMASFKKNGVSLKILSDKTLTTAARFKELSKIQNDSVAMSKIFGRENITAGKVIFDQLSTYEQWVQEIKNTEESQKQASVNSGTFKNRITELKNTFDNLIISGNESSGMLSAFGNIIGFVSNNLGLIVGSLGIGLALFATYKTIMLGINAVTAIWNIYTGISLALQGYQGALLLQNTIALKAYTVAQWLMNTSLLGCPIVWIILGIAALIAGIVLLIKNWEVVKNAVISFVQYAWEGIKKVGQAVLSYLLLPLQLALKLISTLTGAEWAKDMTNKINDMTGSFSVDAMTKEKPVNLAASANDAQMRTIEKTTNKNNTLNLVDRTSGGVKAVRNEAPIPVMGITNDYLNE